MNVFNPYSQELISSLNWKLGILFYCNPVVNLILFPKFIMKNCTFLLLLLSVQLSFFIIIGITIYYYGHFQTFRRFANLRQWSRLQRRLNVFRLSTILKKAMYHHHHTEEEDIIPSNRLLESLS